YTDTKPIDFSSVGGLWVPCAGSVTPWNTHLGSEEYPADARAHAEATSLDQIDDYNYAMVAYFGVDPKTMSLEDYRRVYNPYQYGFPVEVTVTAEGEATPAKHYSMGRIAVELANVMPDQKTAYISDDGTNVGLFRYVADTAGDLSAGQLFAAKWTQTSDEGAGAADISWVDLGHADDATIQKAIDDKVGFMDIFNVGEMAADGTCAEGFLPSAAEGRAECLQVKDGMEAVASRLETRRYASMLGATVEFRKMEGNVYNPDNNSLYLAMSEVAKGMTDGDDLDMGSSNDVRVAKNPCGAVYELSLDDAFVATDMKAVIAGVPTTYAEGSEYAGNECDVDGIANPDNVTYIPGQKLLVIGEDTGAGHQNDVVWTMNTDTGDLTRIMSSPYGSEMTSVDWYADLNGHAYLTAVIQHPYGESDEDKATDAADTRAYVGYMGPFPVAMK
ncbi:MAG: PhoX family protein, partial [Alphaproteobacteria bacterium]|nr:PhoX family protein [Alphaproteobacteria bacterium]